MLWSIFKIKGGYMMHKDRICEPLELKEFAFAEYNPTAFNFARFIESKSGFKYTVIEKKFIIDMLESLTKEAEALNALHNEFKERLEDMSLYWEI
jgi:hypothetical protein